MKNPNTAPCRNTPDSVPSRMRPAMATTTMMMLPLERQCWAPTRPSMICPGQSPPTRICRSQAGRRVPLLAWPLPIHRGKTQLTRCRVSISLEPWPRQCRRIRGRRAAPASLTLRAPMMTIAARMLARPFPNRGSCPPAVRCRCRTLPCLPSLRDRTLVHRP